MVLRIFRYSLRDRGASIQPKQTGWHESRELSVGFESRVVVVENDGFSVAKRGWGLVKKIGQRGFFLIWCWHEGI